eukprot:Awhi_evm1s1974
MKCLSAVLALSTFTLTLACDIAPIVVDFENTQNDDQQLDNTFAETFFGGIDFTLHTPEGAFLDYPFIEAVGSRDNATDGTGVNPLGTHFLRTFGVGIDDLDYVPELHIIVPEVKFAVQVKGEIYDIDGGGNRQEQWNVSAYDKDGNLLSFQTSPLGVNSKCSEDLLESRPWTFDVRDNSGNGLIRTVKISFTGTYDNAGAVGLAFDNFEIVQTCCDAAVEGLKSANTPIEWGGNTKYGLVTTDLFDLPCLSGLPNGEVVFDFVDVMHWTTVNGDLRIYGEVKGISSGNVPLPTNNFILDIEISGEQDNFELRADNVIYGMFDGAVYIGQLTEIVAEDVEPLVIELQSSSMDGKAFICEDKYPDEPANGADFPHCYGWVENRIANAGIYGAASCTECEFRAGHPNDFIFAQVPFCLPIPVVEDIPEPCCGSAISGVTGDTGSFPESVGGRGCEFLCFASVSFYLVSYFQGNYAMILTGVFRNCDEIAPAGDSGRIGVDFLDVSLHLENSDLVIYGLTQAFYKDSGTAKNQAYYLIEAKIPGEFIYDENNYIQGESSSEEYYGTMTECDADGVPLAIPLIITLAGKVSSKDNFAFACGLHRGIQQCWGWTMHRISSAGSFSPTCTSCDYFHADYSDFLIAQEPECRQQPEVTIPDLVECCPAITGATGDTGNYQSTVGNKDYALLLTGVFKQCTDITPSGESGRIGFDFIDVSLSLDGTDLIITGLTEAFYGESGS